MSNAILDTAGTETAVAADSARRHCNIHGDFVAKNVFGKVWTRCPECEREQQEAAIAEANARKEREQAQERRERLEYHVRNCGLSGRYLKATFDTFSATTTPQKTVKAVCKTYVENLKSHGGGLWLIGQPGTGKTHLGAAMVRHVIHELDLGAAMHSVPQMMAMLRARWASNPTPVGYWESHDGLSTTDDLLDFWGRISLLIIDEVGVARGTDHEMETLFTIIDKRYTLEKPTVLLSNLKPAELKPVLGDRCFDRLREGAQLLVCNWPSHRGNASKAASLL